MPRIKAFKALKPNIENIENIVTEPIEYYSKEKIRQIIKDNPQSFLNLINPNLVNPYQRGSYSSLIYKTIEENLDSFKENKILVSEEKPAIYIYQINHDGITQTGIWTLTHINHYLDNSIKKHELTVEQREQMLADYMAQTGLDANPVLITYKKKNEIKIIIDKYLKTKPDISFSYAKSAKHKIWIINSDTDINRLVNLFAQMPVVYIADGHHRAAGIAKMCIQKRNLYADDQEASFNFFSTVYMDTDELKILPYYRFVKDLNHLNEQNFIKKLENNFYIKKPDAGFLPTGLHEFTMYLKSGWYALKAKSHTFSNDSVNNLDVSILQNHVLKPVLGIKDPRTDNRLLFESGKISISKIEQLIDTGKMQAAFLLSAITVDQIIAVADDNKTMPPKSTWIEPKFLTGMLTNYFTK